MIYIHVYNILFFSTANESPAYIDHVISDITSRWSSLLDLLQVTTARLALVSDSKKFEDEFSTLRATLEMYSEWIDAQTPVQNGGNVTHLQRNYGKCKVHVLYMTEFD